MNRYLKFLIGSILIAVFGGAFLFHFSPSILKGKKGLSDSLDNESVQVGQAFESEKDEIQGDSSSNFSDSNQSSGEAKKPQGSLPSKKYFWNSDTQIKKQSNSRGSESKTAQEKEVLDQGKQILPTLRENVAAGRTIQKILEGKDFSVPGVRDQTVAEMRALEERQRTAVLAKAKQLNVPLRIDRPGENVAELYDFRGDEPIYRKTLNVNAAISSGANLVHPAPYNLDGTGIRVGIWDKGRARTTHQELVGRVTIMDPGTNNTDEDHSTHVAGTVGASGINANAKGMAPKVSIDSWDWNIDDTEMLSAGASSATDSSRIPLSNHSYGSISTSSDMGVYKTEAANKDSLAVKMPYYLIFWAAGNSRTAGPNDEPPLTSLGGYQSITYDALAKNIMTVGAVQDAVSGGQRSLTNASMTSFSSWGPCDDGRIKPDVVANGWDIYSSISSGDTSYGSMSGTSQATPAAMGSAALLEQLYAREFSGQRMRASTLKALMIHTADDLGNAGPDYQYGWGLINVKAAADVVLAHKADTNRPKLIEGRLSRTTNNIKTYTNQCTFIWDGLSPIRATLVWTDPEGSPAWRTDSRTPNLKNNLDLKIISPNGATNFPYVMPFVGTWTQDSMSQPAVRGKNNVDNVEQVYLESPTVGTYTASVTVDALSSGDDQVYSLIITGGEGGTVNPSPSVSVTSPLDGASFAKGSSIKVSAYASDLAYGGGPGVVSKVEFFVGGTKFAEDTTAPYSVSWTPSASGGYVLTAKATDSEGAARTSTPITVTIVNESHTPVINSLSVLTGKLRMPFQYQVTASDNPTTFTANGLPLGLSCSSTGLISGIPAVLGSYSPTVSASNLLGSGAIVTLDLQISPPTYLEWLAIYNLSGVNVDEDSDGDGIKNLMEYFMGLDPKVQNSGSFVSVQGDGNSNFLSLTYRKSKEITGVFGVVEWSTDLASGNWSSDGVTDTLVRSEQNYEERKASVPKAQGEVKKFLILRVTQP